MDETIRTLIEVFSGFTSDNDDVRNSSEGFFMNILREDPVSLLDGCQYIIHSDDVPNQDIVVTQAFIAIYRTITPSYEFSDTLIRDFWVNTLNGELKAKIKSAAIRGLLFKQVPISNSAIRSIVAIFLIDRGNFLDIFDIFWEMMNNNDYSFAKDIILEAYRQIFQFGNINSLNCPGEISYRLMGLKNYLFEMCNDEKKSPESLKSYISTLDSMTQLNIDEYCTEGFIKSLFEMFEGVLVRCEDDDLYELIHVFMLNTITRLYDSENCPIERFFDFTLKGITCSVPSFIVISLEAWIHLSEYELDIFRRYRNELNFNECRTLHFGADNQRYIYPYKVRALKNYCSKFASIVTVNLIEMISMIDEFDREIEDPEAREPHMIAHILLKNLYILNSEFVYNQIISFYDHAINSTSWVDWHTCCLLIACISSNNSPKFVSIFLLSTEAFLLHCISTNNDRLTDTALYSIAHCIKEVGMFSRNESFDQLINIVSGFMDKDTSLCLKSLSVIVLVLEQIHNQPDFAPSHSIFTKLIDIFNQINEREDKYANNLLSTSFLVIQTYIRYNYIQNKENCIDLLLSLADQLVISLSPFSFSDENEQLHYQQSLLNLFHDLFFALKSNLMKVANIVVPALFPIVKNQSGISEYALQVLVLAFHSLGNYSIEFINDIVECVNNSLESKNPSLISKTMLVIGSLFLNSPSSMGSYFENTLESIFSIFNDSNFTDEFYPCILLSLANIVEGITLEGYTENNQSMADYFRSNIDVRDSIFQLFYMFLNKIKHPNSIEEEEYVNTLLMAILRGFSSIIILFSNEKDFLLANKLKFFEPAKSIIDIERQQDQLLYDFCSFIHVAIRYLPREFNIVIARIRHYTILLMAESRDCTELQIKAKETISYLNKK